MLANRLAGGEIDVEYERLRVALQRSATRARA